MVDLHLVLPALNLSTLDAVILIMVQQVRFKMFSLNTVDYSMFYLSLFTTPGLWVFGLRVWDQGLTILPR